MRLSARIVLVDEGILMSCPPRPGPRSRVAQNPEALVFVADVNEASAINDDILGLQHQLVLGHRSVALRRLRRKEIADLDGKVLVRHIVDTQTRVEVGDVEEVTLLLNVG
jgi:hypothetical protein